MREDLTPRLERLARVVIDGEPIGFVYGNRYPHGQFMEDQRIVAAAAAEQWRCEHKPQVKL